MNKLQLQLKLAFIKGLKPFVLDEITQYGDICIRKVNEVAVYLDFNIDYNWTIQLKSVSRVYLVAQDLKYNPRYISNHKAIVDLLVRTITGGSENAFRTFNISCAGPNSAEVLALIEHIQKKHGLTASKNADLKIHIIKIGKTWEVGAQVTARPLSFRKYKIANMSGALDPTIAFAMNSLCGLSVADSYLNIFSGSATLLIEAALTFPKIQRLVGFDYNKKHISMAIQNIKRAGLIRKIKLGEMDIFNRPSLGKFDAITSDLPFGMKISKNEDLQKLYQCFVEYSQGVLKPGGMLVVFTSKCGLMKEILDRFNFRIVNSVELRLVSSAGAQLRPTILACESRQ